MSTKFRPITKAEKAKQIGIGLFLAFILASVIGLIAPFIFQWASGFFDPVPNSPPDCSIKDFMDKTLNEYMACKSESNSYDSRMERLSRKIPWFWMALPLLSWAFTRNALRNRIRDDSEDLSYPGQGIWDFVSTTLGTLFFYCLIWVFLARDKNSFIGLGILVGLMLASIAAQSWLLKKYGKTEAEKNSP